MTFTPDLSVSVQSRITLVADGVLTQPANYLDYGNVSWMVYIVQDSVGGHSLSLDDSYRYVGSLADSSSVPNTQTIAQCVTAKNGITVIINIATGLPFFQ